MKTTLSLTTLSLTYFLIEPLEGLQENPRVPWNPMRETLLYGINFESRYLEPLHAFLDEVMDVALLDRRRQVHARQKLRVLKFVKKIIKQASLR